MRSEAAVDLKEAVAKMMSSLSTAKQMNLSVIGNVCLSITSVLNDMTY